MTIHFEITPPVIEFACHFWAAICYMVASGLLSEQSDGFIPVLFAAIVLTVIGAHQ